MVMPWVLIGCALVSVLTGCAHSQSCNSGNEEMDRICRDEREAYRNEIRMNRSHER